MKLKLKFTVRLALVLTGIVLTGISVALAAPLGIYQHGTVIRMRMGDCALTHRGFMIAFGPPQAPGDEGACPEYILMTDKVVFLIVAEQRIGGAGGRCPPRIQVRH
jgi:hypothetical protein